MNAPPEILLFRPETLTKNVIFAREGKEVGRFDFGADPITFTGNVDESAKLFVDEVIRLFKLQSNS